MSCPIHVGQSLEAILQVIVKDFVYGLKHAERVPRKETAICADLKFALNDGRGSIDRCQSFLAPYMRLTKKPKRKKASTMMLVAV